MKTSNDIEEEIRQFVKKNSKISISKIAREFDVDVDTVLDIIKKVQANKIEYATENKIDTKSAEAIPLEIEKEFDLLALIKSEESDTLEFKSSLLVPMQLDPVIRSIEYQIKNAPNSEERSKLEKTLGEKKNILKEELATSVLKTIAAFLNSEGGILLIGVKDDSIICGLEKDIQSVPGGRKNWDGWQQYLVSLIKEHIGTEYTQYIKVKQIIHEDKIVAKVIIEKSARPAYVEKKDVEFYIRSLNVTQSLNTREANNYISDHWKRF